MPLSGAAFCFVLRHPNSRLAPSHMCKQAKVSLARMPALSCSPRPTSSNCCTIAIHYHANLNGHQSKALLPFHWLQTRFTANICASFTLP